MLPCRAPSGVATYDPAFLLPQFFVGNFAGDELPVFSVVIESRRFAMGTALSMRRANAVATGVILREERPPA